jgi:hypothetical protein
MPRMDRFPTFARAFAAAMAALFLTIRAIGGAGYMPMVEHGRLAIMLCPDGEWTAPSAAMPDTKGMHGHGGTPAQHRDPCPYAASATPLAASGPAPDVAVIVAAPERAASASLPPLISSARVQRPFATGPPLHA